jgi:hypothetical protein
MLGDRGTERCDCRGRVDALRQRADLVSLIAQGRSHTLYGALYAA